MRFHPEPRSFVLYTSGYEGKNVRQLLSQLAANGVQCVVDVRRLPLSRKPGFSKKSLEAAVSRQGMSYVHMPELGCPKDILNGYRANGDWQEYTRRFMPYLADQRDAILALTARASSAVTCLLCFEADPQRCHRTYVARATGLEVMHLSAGTAILDSPRPAQASAGTEG